MDDRYYYMTVYVQHTCPSAINGKQIWVSLLKISEIKKKAKYQFLFGPLKVGNLSMSLRDDAFINK